MWMPPVKKGWWCLTDDLRLTLNSPAGTQVLTSLEIRRGQHPVRTTLLDSPSYVSILTAHKQDFMPCYSFKAYKMERGRALRHHTRSRLVRSMLLVLLVCHSPHTFLYSPSKSN